ncbi:YqaA family protein [Roseibium sp.]|uniref:YqaA family protein n=1 Tax=Roseibium sp. TaxID=1936156 RepID=UPI003B50333D
MMPGTGRKRRRLFRWSWRLANSRSGNIGVAVVSFAEATVVPVPLEAVLAPLMLLNPKRGWTLAAMATIGCLTAAAVGYVVGWLFFESVGLLLIDTFGWQEGLATTQEWMKAYGFFAVFVIGVVPIPFQTAMLLAGATGMAFPLFMLAAALSRGARYFGLAFVMIKTSSLRKRRKRDPRA